MPRLYFMRHAKTEINKEGVWSGRTDCSITEEGRELTRKNFSYTDNHFDQFYCSPLKRTKQTLDVIIPGQNCVVDERIIERNSGDWEGMPYDVIDEETTELYIQGKVQPPHGETYSEVKQRVISFVNDMFKKYSTEEILIVTHATIVRMVRDVFLPEMKKGPIKNSQLVVVTDEHYKKWREKNE